MHNEIDTIRMYKKAISSFDRLIMDKEATLRMLKIKYEHNRSEEINELESELVQMKCARIRAQQIL